MTTATFYLNGSPIAEAADFSFTSLFDETIVRANAAITETIVAQNITTEPGSTMGAMVAANELRALTRESVATMIEATCMLDDASADWFSSFFAFRKLTRKERDEENAARRLLRRQLVRLAGSHDRWSRAAWAKNMSVGRYLCGASVPRSLR